MATTNKVDATRNAALAATTPAAFAKAIAKEGKSVRNLMRSRMDVHVSKGDAFGDAEKLCLVRHYLDGDNDAIREYREAKGA